MEDGSGVISESNSPQTIAQGHANNSENNKEPRHVKGRRLTTPTGGAKSVPVWDRVGNPLPEAAFFRETVTHRASGRRKSRPFTESKK